MISRAAAAAPSVSHAVRRQGRLSHGAAATVTAAAAASSAGPGNAALASHEPCPAAAVTAGGCWSPARYKMPASVAPAAAAPAARPASSRNRRRRRAAAITPAAATAKATCTRPVSSRPAGPDPGQVTAGRAGTEQRAVRHRDRCERPGQHQRADDEADDVARMTVPGGRQEPPGLLRDRSRAAGRLVDGRQIAAWMGLSALVGLVRIHAGLRPRSACSGGGTPAGRCVPAGCRHRCCRCWSRPVTRAAVRAQEVPRRIPAVASDSQWAPR